MFSQISIIGVGLIGGSLGLEIKRKKLAKRIVGCGRSQANLLIAKKRKLIDESTTDIKSAVRSADLIILAAPVETIRSQLRIVPRYAKKGSLVMDVGSTKASIVREADKILPKPLYFVGAHPMAGTEESGAGAAVPDLFKGRKCILTPGKKTSIQALKKVGVFWKKLGSEVIIMRPDRHDRIVAAISHLPQIAASALVQTVSENYDFKTVSRIAGTGFRDTTRIAASSAKMWRDIVLANKKNLRPLILGMIMFLKKFDMLLSRRDTRAIERFFEESSRFRKRIS